jgi:conjugative transfer pilus assembly protein TraH
MRRLMVMIVLFAQTVCGFASVSEDLDTFMNDTGFSSNVTSPAAYESQASGSFGGGSVYARDAVRQYQLVTLDLPNYRAGCAGIDLYTGSLSYISGDKLKDLGTSVMTNGGAYAVDVMLASTVPQLKQVRDYLQTTVQKVNQMSVNSCETAQTFVGGVFPKTVLSQQKICNDQHRMGKEGLGEDYVSARMNCAGDGFQQTMTEAEKNPEHKEQVVLNKNIVWSLLKDKTFLSSNTELAEMIMSLTGTLIIDKDGKVRNVPSLVSSGALIQALIGRSNSGALTAKIWHCEETERCLSVSLRDVSIPEDKSLSGHIRTMIAELNTHLKEDTALTTQEKNFLEMTPLPVMKFLVVLNSAHYGDAAVDMQEYATLIAQDMMQQYLSELLLAVSNATQGSVLNESLLADVRQRIESANTRIAAIDPQVSRKLTQKLELINNVVRIEKQLSSSLKG